MSGAFELWRLGMASILDAGSIVALIWLGFQVMFGDFQPFHVEAGWIGAVAAIACLLDPRSHRRVPLGLIGFAAAGLLSSVVHNWNAVNREGLFTWSLIFGPIDYLLYMVVFVFGTAYVLRTPRRQAWFIVLFTSGALVLAGQLLFDRAVTNFEYNRADRTFIPSVSQWSGLHQLGLVFVVGLPLVLSIAITRVTVRRVLSSCVLAAFLVVAAWFNGSKTAILLMAMLPLLMVLTMMALKWRRRPMTTATRLLVGAALAIAAGIAVNVSALPGLTSLTGDRVPIWNAAWHIFLDHPLLGAGPHEYSNQMVLNGYAERFLPWYPGITGGAEQAHSLPLQVAAETGIVGVVSLLWFFGRSFTSSMRAMTRDHDAAIAAAIGFAMLALLARFCFDNFWGLDFHTDRIKPFAWFLFAAAVAQMRQSRRAA